MDSTDKLMRFMESQKAARELIQRDINGGLHEAKKKAIANGKLSYGEEGLPLSNVMESTKMQSGEIHQSANLNFNSPSAKRLPKAILDSIKSNPLDESVMASSSILDELNRATGGKMFEESQAQETVKQNVSNNQVAENTNTSIDYSMIRMICEETMRKYMGSLKKTILSEAKQHTNDSSNTLKAMKIGNKFSFITNDGNIYEAKLVLKGNVNDK